uniref:Talin N-terminal F0 domain-containing protein n=1 Tax=Suricata suricatta TaxID=37032 RepID=A0A673U8C0_SURSU
MPRSPTSSEDEMAQSFSDCSVGSESDSSREETVYDTIRATAERPGAPRTEEAEGNTLVIRILIQDLQQTKCIRFNPDATVWVAKQRILCSLNQSLKDVLNYGLFQPASNGRDGKFLDEERLLREYPQPVGTGVPSLEVPASASRPGGGVEDASLDSSWAVTPRSRLACGVGVAPDCVNFSRLCTFCLIRFETSIWV